MGAFDRELGEAVRLSREAGAIVMRVYAGEFDVSWKGKADPVTIADQLANEHLVQELRTLFANDGVVAEETPDRSDALRRGRVWYVDPLDGTKEFIARNGEFSVMLGLAIDGSATVGVVHQPITGATWAGALGEGAWVERDGARAPLRVSDVAQPRDLRLVVSRSHGSRLTDVMRESLGITEKRQSGSVGLKVGLIVEQRADLYVHPSDKSSAWDACGPEAILRAAGGRFTDLAGDPFVYGGGDLRNRRGIVASNGRCHDAVVDVLSRLARDAGLLPPA